jgi:hypothetical protein
VHQVQIFPTLGLTVAFRPLLIIAPANICVLNDVFAWCIVPLIAVGDFEFIPPMYWTLENLKDSENTQ